MPPYQSYESLWLNLASNVRWRFCQILENKDIKFLLVYEENVW